MCCIILLNAVFNPSLEIVDRSGQQLLIDGEHLLQDMASVPY
jgi:hypothetical protein